MCKLEKFGRLDQKPPHLDSQASKINAHTNDQQEELRTVLQYFKRLIEKAPKMTNKDPTISDTLLRAKVVSVENQIISI